MSASRDSTKTREARPVSPDADETVAATAAPGAREPEGTPTGPAASTRDIAELRADAANPREMDDLAREGLGAAVAEYGDLGVIVWNKRTSELVAGHQRMDRLRAAGATEWKQIDNTTAYIEHPVTHERFAIRVVDWPPEKQRKANLVANNPALQGKFTDAAAAQLVALQNDLDFKAMRLDALAEMLALQKTEPPPVEGESDPDDVVEPPAVAVTKTGDIWILGEHRLMCGDSTTAADVSRLMGGQRAVLMETDPPYGIAYVENAQTKGQAVGHDDIENDELDGEKLQAFLESAIRAALPHLGERCAFYLWHPMLTQGTFFAAAAAADILIHRQIIWCKPSLVFGRGDYHWQHELCFYGWVRGHRPPFYGERNQTTLWPIGRETSSEHPTAKPTALWEPPMRNHTREGEICYEPFSGSGSQIIAGERLRRRVFAMELSPRWCDAAVQRWEKFTGKKATLETAPVAA